MAAQRYRTVPLSALGGSLRAAADEALRGDPETDPADGSQPSRCPVCYLRLARRGGEAECPMGHWRWEG